MLTIFFFFNQHWRKESREKGKHDVYFQCDVKKEILPNLINSQNCGNFWLKQMKKVSRPKNVLHTRMFKTNWNKLKMRYSGEGKVSQVASVKEVNSELISQEDDRQV